MPLRTLAAAPAKYLRVLSGARFFCARKRCRQDATGQTTVRTQREVSSLAAICPSMTGCRGLISSVEDSTGAMGWMSRGACQREDPELFFPIAADGPALQQISAAKRVCLRPPGTRRMPVLWPEGAPEWHLGRNHPRRTPRHAQTPGSRGRADAPADHRSAPASLHARAPCGQRQVRAVLMSLPARQRRALDLTGKTRLAGDPLWLSPRRCCRRR